MGITLDAYFRRGELLVWWALQLFLDFRELSFRNLRVWRWNFQVKWIFTKRVSWVGILKEKLERWEISKKRIRRALAEYPKPISPCRQFYPLSQNRYFTHLMSYGSDWNVENFGDIYEKDTIFLSIFWEISRYFLPVQVAHKHDILTDLKISLKFWYFYQFFLGNFPIFPTSQGRAQDTKSVQFFFLKTKDTIW